MSILETVLIFLGIPLVIYAIIAGLSFLGSPYPGKKPAHYELGQKWDSAPLLWSATDELTVPAHLAGHHGASESAGADLIGGRASGKF
ncbi:MAG: hypothetical protein J2P18_11295 [Nocardia sp.]|nr:hypothetical protein [Nocardia sp.]